MNAVKPFLFLVLCAVSVAVTGQSDAPESLDADARSAFEYLNSVRRNPAAFSGEIGVNLSYVKARGALNWNEALARAARAKALDMAARNYMGHVDPDGYGMNVKIQEAGYRLNPGWTRARNANNFESVSYRAGSNSANNAGVTAIRDLILDKGVNPPGHRNHILGIESFWQNCTDCGIGVAVVPDSRYGQKVYVCVLVAKHDF